MALLDDARASLNAVEQRRAEEVREAEQRRAKDEAGKFAPTWGVELAEAFTELGIDPIPIDGANGSERIMGWGLCTMQPHARLLGSYSFYLLAVSTAGRHWYGAEYSDRLEEKPSGRDCRIRVIAGHEFDASQREMQRSWVEAWARWAIARQERWRDTSRPGIVTMRIPAEDTYDY